MIAEVLVELKLKKVDKTFSYLIPSELSNQINVGIRVLVPFGKQKLEGFVLKVTDKIECDYKLKSIISIIDLKPILNAEMLELGKYLSKKTLATLISCYQTMLPSALKAKKGFNVNKKFVSYLVLNEIKVAGEYNSHSSWFYVSKDIPAWNPYGAWNQLQYLHP